MRYYKHTFVYVYGLRIKAMDSPSVCEYIIYSSLVYSRIVAVVYMCVERVTLKNNQTQRNTRVCVYMCTCVCVCKGCPSTYNIYYNGI